MIDRKFRCLAGSEPKNPYEDVQGVKYDYDGKRLLRCEDENLYQYEICRGTRTICYKAFYGCKYLTKIIIPEGVKAIGSCAFCGCENLEEVNIPSGVEEIWLDTFAGCKNLLRISIPDGVTEIWNEAFAGCTGLKQVSIGENVEGIRYDSIRGFTGLNWIGYKAFMDCTNLNEIRINAVDPPKCDADVFSGVSPENIRLFVPRGSRDAYSKADVWKNFTIKEFDYPINDNWYPLDLEDME